MQSCKIGELWPILGVMLEPDSQDQTCLVFGRGGFFSADQTSAGEFVFVVGGCLCADQQSI